MPRTRTSETDPYIVDGRVRCGAKTRAGGRCRRAPMANGRCWKHGGATPTGAALPQYRHGRYSKDLPQRLFERFQASQADGERIAMDAELSLLDARIGDLLSRVESGEPAQLWRALVAAWAGLAAAQAAGDEVGRDEAVAPKG